MTDLKIVIARSFSRKLNLQKYGGNQYESADFWASYSEEVPLKAKSETQQATSEKLYSFAKRDVEESIAEFIKELASKRIKEDSKVAKKEYQEDKLNSLWAYLATKYKNGTTNQIRG